MLKIFKEKIKSKWLVLGVVVLVFVLFFSVSNKAQAQDYSLFSIGDITANAAYHLLGWLIQLIAWFVGQVLTVVTDILFYVAQYDQIINHAVVTTGWPVVRDLCNMFFIVVLLIIAFATILRIENYSLKRLLPRLVIMAILINFSKTICGLLIDFSQVVMLTFMHSIGNAAGNLYEAFGIKGLFLLQENPDQQVTGFTLLGSMILGLALIVIAFMVISVFTVVLMVRIVAFWILTILSPLAFLATVIPGGQKYAGQWWSQFTNYLVVGPVMAFFLWLALVTVGQIDNGNGLVKFDRYQQKTGTGGTGLSATVTQAGSKESMMKFIVSCCLLIGGLMAAQQMGGMGSKAAAGFVQKATMGGLKKFTGYRWASDRVKGWQGMRETIRKEKVGVGAAKLMALEGKIKGAPGRGLAWAAKGKEGRQADRDRAEAIKLRIESREFSSKASDFEKEAEGLTGDARDKKLKEAADMRTKADDSDKQASNLDKEAKKFTSKEPSWVLTMASKMSHWGAREASHAISYKSKEVGRKQDELKFDNDDEIKRKADDASLDPYERMGSIMEGVKREIFDDGKIGHYRDKIGELSKNNKPLIARYESEVERHYHAQALISNEQKAAYITGGKWNLKDLGADAIRNLIKTVVTSTKVGSFKKQYDELPKARKDAVLQSLDKLIKDMDVKIAGNTAKVDNLNFDKAKKEEVMEKGGRNYDSLQPDEKIYYDHQKDINIKKDAQARKAKVDTRPTDKNKPDQGGLQGAYGDDEDGKVKFIRDGNLDSKEAHTLLREEDLRSKKVIDVLTQSHIVDIVDQSSPELKKVLAETLNGLKVGDNIPTTIKVMLADKNNIIGQQLVGFMNEPKKGSSSTTSASGNKSSSSSNEDGWVDRGVL